MNNWAIIGLGFISQRHVQAIEDIGDKLTMACDSDASKSVKVPNARFFTDYIKMIKDPRFKDIDWVAICTPNYLHLVMIMNLMKNDKNVLCEKPLVIKYHDIENIGILKKHTQLYTVMQLRHNPELQELKRGLHEGKDYEGSMTINLHRGDFYFKGWKGDKEKSGGLLFNIGIHYFDLLIWFFGEPLSWKTYELTDKNANGELRFKNAKITWSLSIAAPMDNQIRRLTINDRNIDLTRHFEDLHTKVYQDLKLGKGVTYDEAGRAIKVIEKMIYER